MRKLLALAFIFLVGVVPSTLAAWGFGSSDPGKVLLRDVNVLTLHSGKMTTGRRSSPVPQLNCIGGSAAGKFKPSVVQCYNRGSDGIDIQWECKSDMDNIYRFGNVEVVCEGYDYPDDPFILKGSCGLEYTLDYTKEGHDKSQGHDYGYGPSSNTYYTKKSSNSWFDQSKSGGFGDLIVLFVIGIVIYAMYKTCLPGNNQEMGDRQYSSTNDDQPPGGYPGTGGGWFNPRSGGTHNTGSSYYDRGDASCGAGQQRPGTGGFWTGMATGGLLGYMFGNRGGYNNTGYGYYNRPNYGGGWGGWGSGGGGGYSSGFSSGSSSTGSSGTRTASGFGGTRRR